MTGHILVVDDDLDIRESMIEVLEEGGYSACGAGNGVEALAYLNGDSPRPDLIILDLMMPVMDGLQFREAQLKLERCAAIPVAVFTADWSARQRAPEWGAVGWIRKPLKLQTLLDFVERVVSAKSES